VRPFFILELVMLRFAESRWIRAGAVFALAFMVAPLVPAQAADVQVRADFSWALPTTGIKGTATVPLTGADALTKLQIWVKTSPIPDTESSAPTAELGPTATSFTYTTTVPNGTMLYGRLKGCVVACGALSVQASKAIAVLIPSVPTGVAVTVTVTVSTSP
jgi:hypothetical protein